MDRAVLINEGRIPVNDSSIDVIVCDYVLEHVDKPGSFLSECARVLAPGGAMFFRTPNSLHYVSLFSRVTPHWVHTAIANRIRGLPEEAHDPWPTFYRLNRRGIIRKTAKVAGISHIELRMIEAEPSYLIFHWLPFLIGVAWERVVNLSDIFSGLRANIFGKLTK